MKDQKQDDGEKAASDSGDETANCPICLLPFANQDIGTPESCDHEFCLRCILEWSGNVNTCPYDRRVFHIIFARHRVGGPIFKKIQVADRQLLAEQEQDEDPTQCEICGEANHEDRMLLCDECDCGYHMDCLTPQLDSIPDDDWYCPECLPDHQQQPSTSVAARGGHAVSIPRTNANRRVYRRIVNVLFSSDEEGSADSGEEGAADSPDDERSEVGNEAAAESDDEDNGILYSLPGILDEAGPAPKLPVKRKATTKRKSAKKRKTSRKRKSKKTTSSSRAKSTTRRRGKKWYSSRKKKSSAKQRLAGKLGLVAPPTGCSLPMIKKKKPEKGEEGLAMFDDQLIATDFYGRSSTDSSPVKAPRPAHTVRTPVNTRPPTKRPPTALSQENMTSSTDLLGSILDGQSLLTTSSKDIQISREGRLSLKANTSSGSVTTSGLARSSTPTQSLSPLSKNLLLRPDLDNGSHASSMKGRCSNTSLSSLDSIPSASSINSHQMEKTDRLSGIGMLNMSVEMTDSGIDSMPNNSPEVGMSSKHKQPTYVMSNKELHLTENVKMSPISVTRRKSDAFSKKGDNRLSTLPSASDKTISSILENLDLYEIRPEVPVMTAYPLTVKKEGRKVYDSRDREQIRKSFGDSAEGEDNSKDKYSNSDGEIDEDVLVLTPPPKSPEAVVVLSTDSEDERKNKSRKPRKIRKPSLNDGRVYRIHDSESESRSRSNSKARKSRSRSRQRKIGRKRGSRSRSRENGRRRNSPQRNRRSISRTRRGNSRTRRSTSRSRNGRRRRSKSPRRRQSRSPRRSRSPIRNRRLSKSPRRSRSRRRSKSPIRRKVSVPRRRTPIKERLGPRRAGSKSPKRSRNRHSSSPARRQNGTRSKTPPRHRNRRKSNSQNRDKSGHMSPTRHRRSNSRSSRLRTNGNTSSTRDSRSPHATSQTRDVPKLATSQTLAAELERNYKRKLNEGLGSERSVSPDAEPAPVETNKSKTKKKSKTDLSSSKKKKKGKRSKTSDEPGSKSKKKKKTKKKTSSKSATAQPSNSSIAQDDKLQVPDSDSRSNSSSSRTVSRQDTQAKKQEEKSDSEASARSPDRHDGDRTPQEMVIDTMSDVEQKSPSRQSSISPPPHKKRELSPAKLSARSPIRPPRDTGSPVTRSPQVKRSPVKASPVKLASPVKDSPVKVSPVKSSPGKRDRKMSGSVYSPQSNPDDSPQANDDSPYSPSKALSDSDTEETNQELERKAEEQALQVIALLKNEVAEPDVIPPAQPPKSVSQKPLVIDWLVQRLSEGGTASSSPNRGATPTRREDTPPATRKEDTDVPASATELSNKQLMDRMVGQERIADEIKIVLKPYYQKATINKDEYKMIMKNCVTKIYARSQGRVNPAKVKDFVEKYIGTVMARRKK